MKKLLPLVIIFVLLAGFLSWKVFFKKKPVEEVVRPSKPKLETINQLPIEEMPYVVLEPKSQTRPQDLGHWLTVTVDRVSDYQKVEYEVEYQAGSLIQGFMHRIDFNEEKAPFSKEGFFGSESKGKYKYDEDVAEGSVLLRFYKTGEEADVLKTNFNLQNMGEKEAVFNSQDGKAVLEVGRNDLNKADFLIIASTLGLPAEVKEKVISKPYGFYSHEQVKLTKAILTFKSSQDLTGAKILGWDGQKWNQYQATVKDGQASAEVDQLGTFVLVAEK